MKGGAPGVMVSRIGKQQKGKGKKRSNAFQTKKKGKSQEEKGERYGEKGG